MELKLAGWMTRFEAERTAAAKAGARLKEDVREKLERWKVAGDVAFAKLSELRAAAARWGRIRDEMEAAWQAIDDRPAEPAAAAPEAKDAQAIEPPPRRRARGG